MPLKLTKPIEKIFLRSFPTIYYSLYTFDKSWRRRWIPASMDPSKALDMLAQWQQVSGKIIKIHHAFIEGVNDTQEHWEELTSTLKARKIHAELNIVDLNPAPGTKIRDCPTQFKQDAIAFWENEMATKAQHVRRVGFDVKASCGMFMGYKEL